LNAQKTAPIKRRLHGTVGGNEMKSNDNCLLFILLKKTTMKLKLLIVIFVNLPLLLSCEKISDPEPEYPKDSFYFNSFESYSDTIGWYGVGIANFVDDAPNVGGKYSIEISGGCVIPHAYYRFDPLTEDCSLVLKCWGKNLSHGGSVSIFTGSHSNFIHISITESLWTKYICDDTLHCNAGDELQLELNSGGIISSAMLVDQIEITEVD